MTDQRCSRCGALLPRHNRECREAILARFEDKYCPEPNSGCWLWTGALVPGSGYGAIWMGEGQRAARAHRVSWELYRGPIPSGLFVCHKCDMRPCVNPDHLFLGTNSDNMLDAVAKKHQCKSRVTHCPKGHAYDEANTLVKRGRRYCRICRGCPATKRYARLPLSPAVRLLTAPVRNKRACEAFAGRGEL